MEAVIQSDSSWEWNTWTWWQETKVWHWHVTKQQRGITPSLPIIHPLACMKWYWISSAVAAEKAKILAHLPPSWSHRGGKRTKCIIALLDNWLQCPYAESRDRHIHEGTFLGSLQYLTCISGNHNSKYVSARLYLRRHPPNCWLWNGGNLPLLPYSNKIRKLRECYIR